MTSFRAEWWGMRPALKRHDKGCVPNASTVVSTVASMRNADSESDAKSDADTERVDESADSVGWDAVQPGARLRTRSLLETCQTMLVEYGTKVTTAEEHWISSQFLCQWESEGRSRFWSSQPRPSSLSSDVFVGWWRMSLTKLMLAAREDRNAGSTRSAAVRGPRPPCLAGSMACDQLLSLRWTMHSASVGERVTSSYSARSSKWWWHGADWRVSRRRGWEKAFFSRERPGWPSSWNMRLFILLFSDSFLTIQHSG